MGVLGLSPFLQKACPDVFKTLQRRFRELSGKTIVFDGTLITQRLHFAPMSHPHRHVLGWYRILQELRGSGVNAICVFDGKDRSLAKQMEVERRRESRRLVAARGQLETERLKRLLKLTAVIKAWGRLNGQERQEATNVLRDAVQGLRSATPLPTYVSGVLELPEDNSPLFRGPRHVMEDGPQDVYGGLGGEELSELLGRTGVPVSGSGEYDTDILDVVPTFTSGSRPSLPPQHHRSDDLAALQELASQDPSISFLEENELLNEVQSDLPPSMELEEENLQAHVDDIASSITSLYAEYKDSADRLDSLPKATPAPTGEDDATEAKTEYMMSKTQYMLTVEEGKFWSQLADRTIADEDMKESAVVLVQKSRILSDSFARRTNPPTSQTYEESKEIIRAMGVPCLEPSGPFEAEALAASMVLHGQADYVGSEDTDVLVYGAPLVRNIAKRSDPLVVLHGTDIRTALQLDQDRFIDFALLLGTDFSQRIKNVGPQRALKFIREHGTIEEVLEREKQYPPRLPPDSYLRQVEVARVVFHTLPPIPDPSVLQNGEPDDVEVKEILHKYGLWKELTHDYDWDYSQALSGNYFDDNPAAA